MLKITRGRAAPVPSRYPLGSLFTLSVPKPNLSENRQVLCLHEGCMYAVHSFVLGKDEVTGSIPVNGSNLCNHLRVNACTFPLHLRRLVRSFVQPFPSPFVVWR